MYFGSVKDYQYYCIKEKKSLTFGLGFFVIFVLK